MLLVDFLYVLANLFWVLERFFNCANGDGDFCLFLLVLAVLEVQYLGVSLVQTWLVQDSEAQLLLVVVRPLRFQEVFNGSDSGDVVGNEGLDLGLQVHQLRLIEADLLEQFSHVVCNLQAFVVLRVVLALDEHVLLVIFVASLQLLLAFEGRIFEPGV